MINLRRGLREVLACYVVARAKLVQVVCEWVCCLVTRIPLGELDCPGTNTVSDIVIGQIDVFVFLVDGGDGGCIDCSTVVYLYRNWLGTREIVELCEKS